MLVLSAMETGNIVEYIDQRKIICAVVLEIKNQRLRILNENNREINLSENRLSHKCQIKLNTGMGRDDLVENLKATASRRNQLIHAVNVKELWEVLNSEQQWIDLATMTAFCFPDAPTADHESAVLRAFFNNRLFFKFKSDSFFPYTEKEVKRIIAQTQEAERQKRIIDDGCAWLKTVLKASQPTMTAAQTDYIKLLKIYYLEDKEDQDYKLAKSLVTKAGLHNAETIFQLLVKLGVWDRDENIDLIRHEIRDVFTENLQKEADQLAKTGFKPSPDPIRRDLTHLPTLTIDGQGTSDHDDALSLEDCGTHFRLGIHITDVGHYIRKESGIDQEAALRTSSIYMPDIKIPMMPAAITEDLCSLIKGKPRNALSVLVDITANGDLLNHEIVPSVICVDRQMTYYEVNLVADEDHDIAVLRNIARRFRQSRLDQGAVQITLPEINIWLDENNQPNVSRINRESPGRLLVAELMIMANWLMARFLAQYQIPGIFRSQPPPRNRLFESGEGTLFQNWMQRKHLSRFVLGPDFEHHSGLGLDAYVTATSPIRKYIDLVTQRQLRAALGLEKAYQRSEIEQILQMLKQPMATVFRLQHNRHRYWLLKYLEKRVGKKEEAIVIGKRRNNFAILMAEYMLECTIPQPSGTILQPEDLVQVTIQHVSARNDVLNVFMG